MMTTTVDACGLSCPEPAMLARQALLQVGKGTLIVRVDAIASRENVCRTASLLGWQAAVEDKADGSFTLTLTK